MKEYLFIRFFINSLADIPLDSIKLCHTSQIRRTDIQEEIVDHVTRHMELYPCGKVDFVWASVEGIM